METFRLLLLNGDELPEAVLLTVRSGELLAKMPATAKPSGGLDCLGGLRSLGLLGNHVGHTNLPLGIFVNLYRRARESGSAP